MLDCSFRFQEINNKVLIPFEINDTPEMPLYEIDPDIQFYSNSQYSSNTKCNYYFEDSFKEYLIKNDILPESKSPLSLFHMNIRSLPKHYDLHKDIGDLYSLSTHSSKTCIEMV